MSRSLVHVPLATMLALTVCIFHSPTVSADMSCVEPGVMGAGCNQCLNAGYQSTKYKFDLFRFQTKCSMDPSFVSKANTEADAQAMCEAHTACLGVFEDAGQWMMCMPSSGGKDETIVDKKTIKACGECKVGFDSVNTDCKQCKVGYTSAVSAPVKSGIKSGPPTPGAITGGARAFAKQGVVEPPTTTEQTTTTEQATAEQPTTEAPTTEEPATEQATVKPTTSEPTTAEPTTEQPTTEEPTTAQPTTVEPTTEQPRPEEPNCEVCDWSLGYVADEAAGYTFRSQAHPKRCMRGDGTASGFSGDSSNSKYSDYASAMTKCQNDAKCVGIEYDDTGAADSVGGVAQRYVICYEWAPYTPATTTAPTAQFEWAVVKVPNACKLRDCSNQTDCSSKSKSAPSGIGGGQCNCDCMPGYEGARCNECQTGKGYEYQDRSTFADQWLENTMCVQGATLDTAHSASDKDRALTAAKQMCQSGDSGPCYGIMEQASEDGTTFDYSACVEPRQPEAGIGGFSRWGWDTSSTHTSKVLELHKDFVCVPAACNFETECGASMFGYKRVEGNQVDGCECICNPGFQGDTCTTCLPGFVSAPNCPACAEKYTNTSVGYGRYVHPGHVTPEEDVVCGGQENIPVKTDAEAETYCDSIRTGGGVCNGFRRYLAEPATNQNPAIWRYDTCVWKVPRGTDQPAPVLDDLREFVLKPASCGPTPCQMKDTECSAVGTASVGGDLVNGCTCACKPGYEGARCDMCAEHYKPIRGVTGQTCAPIACQIQKDCASDNTISVKGYVKDGCDCLCKIGYNGTRCDQCATNYSGTWEPKLECSPRPCTLAENCAEGAIARSGDLVANNCKCVCKVGFAGDKCQQCATGFTGFPSCVVIPATPQPTPQPTTAEPTTEEPTTEEPTTEEPTTEMPTTEKPTTFAPTTTEPTTEEPTTL